MVFDLRPLTRDIDGEFLGGDGLDRTRLALDRHELTELPGAAALRVGAPIARSTAVICVGQNYAAHAAESGDPTPTVPIVFFKHPNTIVLDWEVELGVVIGARGSGPGATLRRHRSAGAPPVVDGQR
jgi:2-keto-4-pentenoate hydratase/2-oxohepta-3-ene-1,7-dioic acid hydratase in catechol pathway